ncbi:unnamed protein product [Ectocarpus sp. CCAP 1310/34]|nr:unnamed protein product [Ectocarpus sp. CCAP 1310/34]
MSVRPRQSSLNPVAVALASAALLLSTSSPVVSGAPVVVTDYKQLVGTIGSNNDYDTGERFAREGMVLVHKGDESCAPDFDTLGLSVFGDHPDMYSLVSVDADHADKELLDKLGVDPATLSEPKKCPSLSIVPRRSTVEAPAVILPTLDKRGSYHLNAVKTQQVSVGIVNEMDFDLDIHYQWWNEPVKPTHIRTLAPGTENWMLSYKTTLVLALNKETQEEVSRYLVKGHGLFTVAERSCTAETCGTSEGTETPQDVASRNARKQMDQGRLVNNRKQPEGLPRFTEVGFKKTTVPDDVWDLVKTYYEENKESPKKEKWSKNNVFTNNVEAPSYMVNLPENGKLKEQIFGGLRPILEEWSGVELVQTACYGVRVYTNTSWLANHVDTKATHAVSVIMQVDQDVEEDWPLMIYDHAGNDYNITMKPRDLVLYESATCVHGRPSTFHGNYYANAFVHYKPKDPEKWSKFID